MKQLKSFYKRSVPLVVGASIMIGSGLASAAGETPEGAIDPAPIVALIKQAGITVGLIGVACMAIVLAIKGFQWAKSAIK